MAEKVNGNRDRRVTRLVRLATWLAFALLCSCAVRPTGTSTPLHVTGFSPTGEIDEAYQVVRIHFDQPVVSEHQVGRELTSAPVRIEPALQLRATWTDRQTLTVRPLSPMQSSTRYRVRLVGALAQRMAEPFSFAFVHDPLRVEAVTGVDPRWVPRQAVFTLRFNHAVHATDVLEHCVLQPRGEHSALELYAADPSAESTHIELASRVQLERGTRYLLRCGQLQPRGHNTGLQQPYEQPLRALPALSVENFSPTGQGRVTPDELTMTLELSTPVDPQDLAKHIRISPAVDGFRDGWVRRESTTFEVSVNLKASTRYTMRIDKSLKDAFGQPLSGERRYEFETSDASPRMQLETGIYAVEASSDGYPVWSRNVPAFQLQCAHVPKRHLVKLLTSQLDYDPWYGYDRGEIDFKSHKLRPKMRRIEVPEAKNKWQLSRVDLAKQCGNGKRGVYLGQFTSSAVEKDLERGYYPYRVLGNVTDLGVLLKVGPGSGLVWVTQLSSGEPVPHASVTVYSPQGKRVHTGRTDAMGVLKLPGSATLLHKKTDRDPYAQGYEEIDYYRSQRLIAVVETDQDLAVVDGNWANGIQTWNFGLRSDRRGASRRIRGFIQSDRGIYRPGETVHLKGLVREVAMGQPPRVPKARRIQVDISPPGGGSAVQKKLKISPFGGFHMNMALPEGARTGDYRVVATLGGQRFVQTFSVEEFRPVALEIEANDAPKHIPLGRALKLKLEANYLFGAPVKDAPVQWSVQRRERSLRFARFAPYSFGDHAASDGWWWYSPSHHSEHLADGELRTDNKGRFIVKVNEPTRGLTAPQDYIVRATVTDTTDQKVSKTVVVAAHPTDHYLGLHAQEWVQAVDMPFAVNAVAVKPNGTRIAHDATLTYFQKRWECKRSKGYRAHSECKRADREVFRRKVRIPSNGTLTERIMPKSPGEFGVRIESKDRAGRRVVASTSMWIIGKGEAFWSGDESARMGLIASKDRYEPGESARLVPRTDTRGATMLVTTERDGVLDARIVKSDSSSSGITVPLQSSHAPNVFVSVAMVKGRRGEGDALRPEFKLGVAELRVSAERERLQVEVTPAKEDYRPGEQVRGTLRVTSGGKPVQAEVALSAADEGVLQLVGFQTPDPMDDFYKPWGLGVDNGTNLNRVARLQDPREEEGEEGADHGGNQDGLRTNFVSSAFWKPALVTDTQGRASFSFKAPDNLTAFRLMAVAADRGTRFGSSDTRIRVRKELLIKPGLPRFLRSGDRATLSAVVHNYTDRAGEAQVSIEIPGVRIARNRRTLTIPAGGSKAVRFQVAIGDVDSATVRMRARMGDFSDGLERTLPVHRPHQEQVVQLDHGRSQTAAVALTWPDGLDESSELIVSVDRTGMADMGPSLRYLIRYPYGCLEQTMSRLVPMLKVSDLAESLKLPELKGPRLKTYVKLGVAKVLRHQHADGHFSLWPSSPSYPHLTAFALWGLGEAKRSGVKVEQRAIDRGAQALRRWANDGARDLSQPGMAATMAMAAFTLADHGHPDHGLHARLYEARSMLPLYGKALLLRAMQRAGASRSMLHTLRDELLADHRPGELLREHHGGMRHYFSSDVRTTALAISALLELPQRPAQVDQLVAALKGRRSHGRWSNTQENAYALIALADQARDTADGLTTVRVTLEGKRLFKRTLRGGQVQHMKLPLTKLRKGELRIEADAPLYYAVRRREVRRDPQSEARRRGMGVVRTYLDHDSGKPIEQARVGQLIRVRLEVQLDAERRYVALTDPLPAGLEAVNTRLATENPTGTRRGRHSYRWVHRDLRDERVDIFADHLRAGTHTTEYLARATTAGNFTAAAAHAHEMYAPHVMGRSASRVLKVVR